MLSLADGFIQSSVLFALLKLRIFELIGDGTKSLLDLAKEADCRPETLSRLLNAGVLLNLLISKDGGNFEISPDCHSVMLPSAGENYLGNFILNLHNLYPAFYNLDEAVFTSGPTIDPSTILGSDKEQTKEFALAMHNYASIRGKELANFLDTSSCSSLLDLGSGPGTYSFHLGLRNPDLEISLLDHPGILEVAKEIQKLLRVKNEVHYFPQDILEKEIPGTYDMILVSNALHMLGEEVSRKLIKQLYNCINPGGSLVIQANFLMDDRAERWPVFMDLMQLCVTPAGRNHTLSETKEWLSEAGFKDFEYNSMTIFNTNSYLRGYKA